MAIIYVTCCWFAGIWLASGGTIAWPVWLAGAAAFTLAALVLRRHPAVALIALCLAALCGGGARQASVRPRISAFESATSSDAASTIESVAAYNGERALTLVGQVAGEPRLSDGALTVHLASERLVVAGEERRVVGMVLVRLPRFTRVYYGDRLEVRGRLETPPRLGVFDYRAHLARRGIHSQMLWPVLEQVDAGRGVSFYRALFAFKMRALATIDTLFPGQEAALLKGILLGNDEGLAPSLQEAFRRTGTSHVIAISGFNISLLVGMLLAMARPFLGGRRAAWVPLVGVALYTILVGADAAVVRAAIMGSLYVGGGRLLGRPTFAPAGLFSAGLLMTIANPLLLEDVGFQLSFAATLGLMIYVPPLSGRVRTWLASVAALSPANRARIVSILVETVLVTLVAQVTTMPLLLYHFGQLSLVSLPANLLILPVQPAIMIAGGGALLVGLLSPPAALPLAWVTGLFLRYTIGIVRVLADVPLAAISLEVGPASIIIFYSLLLVLTWWAMRAGERHQSLATGAGQQVRRALPVVSGLLLLLASQWARSQPDGYLHVAFLDVGQGDAIFIQSPSGRQVLVDGGHYPSRLNEQLGRHLPFWDRHLDLLVATHPDADHVSGLPDLLRRYRVDLLLTGPEVAAEDDTPYGALLASARTHGVGIRPVRAGERVVLEEGLTLTCVHPGPVPLAEGNENSVALRLDYGDFSLLLTGDAGEAAEQMMVDGGQPLPALVLKAGHHGARTSSNDFFLAATQPQFVIVSTGVENRFGHPHPEMLARAATAGATVLRTDQLGTIEVTTDGRQMWWEAAR